MMEPRWFQVGSIMVPEHNVTEQSITKENTDSEEGVRGDPS